nr:hypothetical protein [uncultured Carboxylicivirga sp.]
MKEFSKHTGKVEDIINTPLVDKELNISSDFINKVMDRVDNISKIHPYLRYMVNIAASLAFVMLIGNLLLVLKQINASAENQVVEEWASAYENNENSHWSVYYDIELLASSEKTK